MGHYDEFYEREEERREAIRKQERAIAAEKHAKLVAANKAKYPLQPSKWGISLDERVTMLEERLNRLDNRLGLGITVE